MDLDPHERSKSRRQKIAQKMPVLRLKNCSFVIYEKIRLLKVSYERGDFERFFKTFKGVRSYPYSGLILILENENDECRKLDARG